MTLTKTRMTILSIALSMMVFTIYLSGGEASAQTTGIFNATNSNAGDPTNLDRTPLTDAIDFEWDAATNWVLNDYILQYNFTDTAGAYTTIQTIDNSNSTQLTQSVFNSIYGLADYRIIVDDGSNDKISNVVRTSAFYSPGSFTSLAPKTTFDVITGTSTGADIDLTDRYRIGSVPTYTGQYTVAELKSANTANGGTVSVTKDKPSFKQVSRGSAFTNCNSDVYRTIADVRYEPPTTPVSTDSFTITLEKFQYRQFEGYEPVINQTSGKKFTGDAPGYICELTGETQDVVIQLTKAPGTVCSINTTSGINFGEVAVGEYSGRNLLAVNNDGDQTAQLFIKGTDWSAVGGQAKVMDVGKTRYDVDATILAFDAKTELTKSRTALFDGLQPLAGIHVDLQLVADLIDKSFRGKAQQTITTTVSCN